MTTGTFPPPAELPEDANRVTTARLEQSVTLVLRIGVSVSVALLVAGMVRTLAVTGTRRAAAVAVPALRRGALHQAGWPVPHTIAGVVHAALHGQGPGLVMLGVLLLVATPVARVAVSVAGFARERDRRFVVVTALVLAVLLGSFAVG